MSIEDKYILREKALKAVEDKFGIEEFMSWFIEKHTFFDTDKLMLALDAWNESKSREAVRWFNEKSKQGTISTLQG